MRKLSSRGHTGKWQSIDGSRQSGSSACILGCRAVSHSLSSASKPMVHLTRLARLTYFARNHLTGAWVEPFSYEPPQNLFWQNRLWGRGLCTVTKRWVRPSPARLCREGLDQGDKYRLSVFLFLTCIHQEVFLKVQKKEVIGASPNWAWVLALPLTSWVTRCQSLMVSISSSIRWK